MNKNITVITLLTASLFMVGCSTVAPLLTPAALTKEVSQGIKVGLDVYPAAAPDVALARDVVCAATVSTNVSTATIVSNLESVGITNSNSKIIIDGALLLYDGIYALLGTNNTGVVQPYTTALCDGFTAGLSPVSATAKASRKLLPPHLR
jgi:hypothetical protein